MNTKSYLLNYYLFVGLIFVCLSCEIDKKEPSKHIFSRASVIADYPFNGNANDTSDNMNPGVVDGPVFTLGRNNVENGALLFDGIDDLIEFPNSLALNSDSNFSIETWISKDCFTSDGKYFDDAIYGQTDGAEGTDYPTIVLEINMDKTIRGAMRGSDDPALVVTSDATIENGKWHHLVLVRNAEENNLAIFLDGNLVDTADTILVGNTTSNDFVSVGAIFDDLQSLYHFYCGKIDMIRFWRIALSQSEISALKNDNYKIE